jgi:hypothetical protein
MRLILSALAAILTLGCASPGMPPGGPPDVEAPRLVGIAPDSGRVSVSPRSVIFRFDEVVSETPPGATTLANLFVISPQHGTPVVQWQRDEISVRPRRGWRPNTAYTVRMLPGLADLRGNVRKEGAMTLFATGPLIPATAITGVLFDWEAGTPVAAGLVQAMAPDSTLYVAHSDSAGMFTLPYLPAGSYEVTGVVDRNGNRALDPRESWDSATVALADRASVELFAFVHDSTGPRVLDLSVSDSITLRVLFDVPVDARASLDQSWIRVLGPDSMPRAIAAVSLPDSAPADTTAVPRARPADTAVVAPRVPRPTMERARPYRGVTVVMAVPLEPGGTYTVIVDGFPGLLGRVTPSTETITVPRPAPPAPPAPPVSPATSATPATPP